jgi:predicted nuclease with TOPRIM domain
MNIPADKVKELNKEINRLKKELANCQDRYNSLVRSIESDEEEFRVKLKTEILNILSYTPPARGYWS